MTDIELTTLPLATDAGALRTLGFDAAGGARQVPLAGLLRMARRTALAVTKADTATGEVLTATPFEPGTSAVYLNGLRQRRDVDYTEITASDGMATGIRMVGIGATDDLEIEGIEIKTNN